MQYRGADKHLHTHVLLYCIPVYSYLFERVGHCTEMLHISLCINISVPMCAVFLFIWFSVNVCCFSFLLVTNLLINCEDVSCPLTCFQITSWFFWFLLVFRSVRHKSQNIWRLFFWNCKDVCSFLHLIFYSSRRSIVGWFPMGHHFLTPRCHKVKLLCL